MIHHN